MSKTQPHRRLAAIMVTDVVGYSRLIEADEARTLAAVRVLRSKLIEPHIAQCHGRTVKLMGDGAIVEFGSVVDAVACAVAVQKEVASHQAEVDPEHRIVLRIGINLGDVVVEGDDLLGDGVNVAARLQQLCPPGGVLVSGTAYDHLQGKLDLPLDFAGEQNVKNISRPIRSYSVRMKGAKPHWRPSARWSRRRPLLAAAILVALLVAAGGVWFLRSPERAGAAPSIAVLPFSSIGGDEATGRLAEGMTEDIITDLARYGDLDVIARNSTEQYKGRAVDLRQVGKDLNVSYVLEGSIQRQANLVRITAQLIETANGSHVWSERWDRPAEDVFAVQTEVAERVANTLGGYNLLLSESRVAARRKRPSDLEAYDLYVLAYEADQEGTQAAFERGIKYADAAIARDPGLARAYVQKGWLLFHLAAYRKNWNETFVEMERLARTAIGVDPNEAIGHVLLAFAIAASGRSAEFLEAAGRARQLNPSSADALNMTADGMPFAGRAAEGATMCDRSFRLNPNPPAWYHANCVGPYLFTQRFKEAIDAANRWRTINPLNPFVLVMKAAAQAELGREAEATETISEIKQRYPEVSFEYLLNNGWQFDREQDEQFVLDAVRKAGVRICATEQELQAGPKPRRLPECMPTP